MSSKPTTESIVPRPLLTAHDAAEQRTVRPLRHERAEFPVEHLIPSAVLLSACQSVLATAPPGTGMAGIGI